MAKVTLTVCDMCGDQIEGQPNYLRITKKGDKHVTSGDICDQCIAKNLAKFPTKLRRVQS